MKKELEDQLKNNYKIIYPENFGFQCGDGWFDIINNLSRTIVDYLSHNVPDDLKNQIQVVQVKEKFGSLRFYTNHSTPYINGAIALAEAMSDRICEFCGEKGSLRQVQFYYFTACEKHYKKEVKRRS